MTVVASFSLNAETFSLGRALMSVDGGVRLESVVPVGRSAIPYLWIHRESSEGIERRLAEEPLIKDAEIIDEVGDERLMCVEWSDDLDDLIGAILDADAAVLEAVGDTDTWSLQLRFTGYDALSAFYHDCTERGIDIQLDRMDDLDGNTNRPAHVLTDEQRRTLETAVGAGYFSVPRETTLDDLASQLDVSDSAVSQRIRRGLERLLTTTLVDDDPPHRLRSQNE